MTNVVKVGGSLFLLPQLRHRLSTFLPAILVPGGGACADAVREWDAVHGLGDETAHWLALRACSVNAQMLAALTGLPLISHPRGGCGVLDAFAFLQADEGQPGALPHSWDATSDSIAARAAEVAGSALILLKSTESDGATDLVDPLFPSIVKRAGLKVRVVNLREGL